ncbi:protein kinase family protein [Nocardiopsis sp. Huas11]|uniref:protein kinase family protein n=1 Tax=Nocardiopsis sp. Huas11 TaxID=2183912 RepID=UPI000EB3D574|nr:protein kinase family protein [Nocardiopsis sp. Huas11]
MSTFLIEPGAKLANRYRLDTVVTDTGGATRWKATDETLARPVAVWTFAEGFPRTSEVVRAARATSRIPDARVTQVFDADDTGPIPYVVEEWVIGSSLAELLAQGPMAPERAAGLVAEAAEAIAAAHAGGLTHLCLAPDKLMWSSGGAVKVIGIGVDAALRGAGAGNAAAIDAQGLGALLYAGLTGHWPGGAQSGLPAAPQGPAGTYPPGQVRPGLPEPLATITARAALPQLAGQMVPGPPILSPADLCTALAEVPRLIPLPVAPAESAPPPEHGTSRRTGEFDPTGSGSRRSMRGSTTADTRSERPDPSRMDRRASRSQASPKRFLIGVLAVVLFVGVVAGAWTIGVSLRPTDDTPVDPSAGSADDPADTEDLTALEIARSDGYDPLGDGSEHGDNAGLAHDGDATTDWSTEGYTDPLEIQKEGVGLKLDLGASQDVHTVQLTLPEADHAVQVRVGDSDAVSDPATLDEHLPTAWEGNVNGTETIEIEGGATGQYVVIWFTELPQVGPKWRGTIYEVEVLGA